MRYKEFNRNRVLEKCIPLFWMNGFRACAISDIVEETGVNRFSLYEEFGNKEGILIAALQLYKDRYSSEKLKILLKDGTTEELVNEFYSSFFDNDNKQDGCFIIHVGVELAEADKDVQAFLRSYMDEIESLFIELLNRDPETKPNSAFLARNLIGLFFTSMSFCLIHSEEERMHHIENGINVILKNTSYA